MVWFLAPTVALCSQQHAAITSQLPAARTLLLLGSDNVDRWSEQRIWDGALKNVRVVVSTHAVLADALGHGFVRMTDLALLIFDEAHHCARKHPANKIMRDFYHPQKSLHGSSSVPHILGLTASPIIRSKIGDLRFVPVRPSFHLPDPDHRRVIEANLDSTSHTPRLHRQEMLRYVHRPTLRKLRYVDSDPDESVCSSVALIFLEQLHQRIGAPATDLAPHSFHGQTVGPRSRHVSWTDQLEKFYLKSVHIYRELGSWAADYFIVESIELLRSSAHPGAGLALEMRADDKRQLLQVLHPLTASIRRADPDFESHFRLSSKVRCLISFLDEQNSQRCAGLVFVRQRATVGVLSQLLSVHPETRDRFRCATFVGLSNSSQRRFTMAEVLDLKTQGDTLARFKLGEKNLVIATDALEEGIDITACNLVVCFDPPANLKSFLQRRGRARKEESTFAIMVAHGGDTAAQVQSWQALEEEMIRTYQGEMRTLHRLDVIERTEEEVEGEIVVPSTGARLTADSAMAHLYHFCALLPRLPYVDLRPVFTFTEHPIDLVTATVTLPSCVSSLVRTATGKGAWNSERTAIKDAAFQAYSALFQAGLLNQNLLPLTHDAEMLGVRLEALSATVKVRPQFDPWSEIADAWPCPAIYETTVTLREQRGDEAAHDRTLVLATPLPLPSIHPFHLYWSATTTFTVHCGQLHDRSAVGTEILQSLREATRLIHRSFRSDRTTDDRLDFAVLISPGISKGDLSTWWTANRGRRPAAEVEAEGDLCRGLVRTSARDGVPYVFRQWHRTPDDKGLQIQCLPLPRRRNFLQRWTLRGPSNPVGSDKSSSRSTKVETFLARDATVDLLPMEVAQCGLFMPAILQHIELQMTGERLCATVLRDVRFHDIRHVVTAIMCPAAQWLTNYQRYEFIGDSVLKFTVSCQLFANYRHWHEGYLSEARSQLVSNNSLAHAAIRVGLDAYIIMEPLRAQRCSPLYVSDIQRSQGEHRDVPVKVLADVVEALIGAAFIDGGLTLARSCIHLVLPELSPQDPSFDTSYPERHSTGSTDTAESLIGYRFHHKALLFEALTHPACERDVQTESYQRLEFLGDAVLDMLVTSFLAGQDLSQGTMTEMKAALVNANLLGFLCMDFRVDQNVVHIQEGSTGVFEERCRPEPLQLWKFMRHHHREIADAQARCQERYGQLRGDIRLSMDQGRSYPWVELTRLSPDKFYSDLIESTLGAIFVDSGADLAVCQAFIERIGVARYLRRMVADDIDIVHPRNALARAVGSNKVKYSVEQNNKILQTYRCTVSIGGLTVVEIGDCLTKDESIVAAADAATRMLRASSSKHGKEDVTPSPLTTRFDLP